MLSETQRQQIDILQAQLTTKTEALIATQDRVIEQQEMIIVDLRRDIDLLMYREDPYLYLVRHVVPQIKSR